MNTAYALDPCTNEVNKYNAHTYVSSSDSVIAVDEETSNTVRIRLVNIKNGSTTLYLTAISGENGTSSGKPSTSAGNLYWLPYTSDNKQIWCMSFIPTGSRNDYHNRVGQKVTDMTSAGYGAINNYYPDYVWGQYEDNGTRHYNCTYYCWGRA